MSNTIYCSIDRIGVDVVSFFLIFSITTFSFKKYIGNSSVYVTLHILLPNEHCIHSVCMFAASRLWHVLLVETCHAILICFFIFFSAQLRVLYALCCSDSVSWLLLLWVKVNSMQKYRDLRQLGAWSCTYATIKTDRGCFLFSIRHQWNLPECFQWS